MKVTESERAFLHELHAIRKDAVGKRIIHFCVSMAPKTEDMFRRVENAKIFLNKSFSKSPYGKVFDAHNGDIFVTYSHVTVSEVLALCSKVEKLFMEDMVVTSRNPYGEYGFYKISDAVKELEKVFVIFKAIIALAQPEPDMIGKKSMAPEHMTPLMEKLRSQDVRHCIFNQPVYYIGEKVPSIEFLEFYVSCQQIQTNYLPENNMQGNPWLFHAMREDLDRATLKAVGVEIPQYRHKGFSVNVTLASLMGKEFSDFYDQFPTTVAGRIIVEIHKTDMLENMGVMRQARTMVEARNFKYCIDGVEWQDFEVLNLGKLKPDFVKLMWSTDLTALGEEELRVLVEGIKSLDSKTKLIMSRCDDARAFLLARSLGIRFVQGRLADQYFKSGMRM